MKIKEPNDSKSESGENIFGCPGSFMQNQEVFVMSYSEQSPCSPNISPGAHMIAIDQALSNEKYLTTSPSDAPRYIVETYRNTSDDTNQERFVIDARCSNEQYRPLAVDTQRMPSDLQRIRIDDQGLEVYANAEDVYRNNPIDLQRVPDFNLHSTDQRDSGDLPRLSMEAIRHLNDRSGSHMEVTAEESYLSSQFKDSRSESISQSPRPLQETSGRSRADSQRLIQESLLREYFNPRSAITESFRGIDERLLPDDIHYTSSEGERLLFRRQDNDVYLATSLAPESIRIEGSETPHSLGSENLRVSPESACVMPENLCLSESNPVQIMPEDLHIEQNLESVSGGSDEIMINRRTITHAHQMDLTPVRSHYQSNGHVVTENAISFRENVRVPSPQYIESYHVVNNSIAQAPPTPAPSVPPLVEAPSTPISSRYYSSIAYTPTTPQQSHLGLTQHQFNGYINDGIDDREFKSIPMTVEERIERGYHDIKPFDQEYPVSVPLMHMTQESLSSSSIVKQPAKLKKSKEPKPPRAPIVHSCSQCDRTFKNSTQLKNHMWRHTGEKPFTCEECGSKFTQQGNLRAHKRIHTGERPYHCTDCKASFTQLSTLKTHQKIHSDERPYKCNECDAAFRQVANLKTHQVTHTGERPHKCDLCEKAFTQKSNLKAHKNRVHCPDHERTGSPKRGRRKTAASIKPFVCAECGSKFTVMSNLKIHMKLHGCEKPFQCEHCGAEFAQRSNLKTHIDRMHSKSIAPSFDPRRFHCDECPATFRLKRCLKTHKKKRHPIKSLKIKILRQSQLMNEDGSPNENEDEGHSCDEDGEGHYCQHEDLSDDDEETPLSVKVELTEQEFLGHIDKENLPTEPPKMEPPSLAYPENPEDVSQNSATYEQLDERRIHEDHIQSIQSNSSSLSDPVPKEQCVSYG